MTRATRSPKSIHWRLEKDYMHKLSSEERLWIQKFDEEFHLGFFRGEPLHFDESKRRNIVNDKNAARRDIVTAPESLDLTKPVTHISIKYYCHSDWFKPDVACSPEDAIIDMIDHARARMISKRKQA